MMRHHFQLSNGRRNRAYLSALLAVLAAGLPQHAMAASSEFRAADVEQAVQKLYSDNQEDRASAGESLSEMGPTAKAAVPRLIEIVETDPVMSVRGEAAKALGNIGAGAASATSALINLVKFKDAGIERAYAATALGNIHANADAAVPVLAEIAQNDDQPVVRRLAARALGDFGADATSAVPVLIQDIKTTDKDLRTAAIDSLQHIPAAASDVPALTELLSDELTGVRGAAAKSLSGAGAAAAPAVGALTKLLVDADQSVRESAIQALGAIGKEAKSALPALRQATKDPTIKDQAQQAINTIKSAK